MFHLLIDKVENDKCIILMGPLIVLCVIGHLGYETMNTWCNKTT
jgi:hypothetical protein